jgi:tripartite-type tricarboxylate transporter receptor subunit TctC
MAVPDTWIGMHRRALLLSALAFPALARAQGRSDQPIRIIVPFPPGGGVDIVARLLARPMRAALGLPITVENHPGAAGQIGTQWVAHAAPDGTTLLLCSAGEVAVASHVASHRQGDHRGYDLVKGLTPVTLVTRIPNVLFVQPALPARTPAELIALAKAQPGRLAFSSSGIGNLQHLNGELFNRLAGVEIMHVPYRGTAPALAEVAAGRITMTFCSLAAALPFLRRGQVRALAVTSRTRLAVLPAVPALAETPALANYDLVNWFGLFAPGGTPSDCVAELHEAAAGALRDPALVAKLAAEGAEAAPMTPTEFADFIAGERAKLDRVIHATNIHLED